jgi:hypothetical protein
LLPKHRNFASIFFGEAQITTEVDKKKNSYCNKHALKISERVEKLLQQKNEDD